MVSVGISKAESLISLTNDFTQKIEGMIDEKSKSIADMLTKHSIYNNNYKNLYYHPYALNPAL